MKNVFLALLLAGPMLAMACIPNGDRLNAKEKAAFAKELQALNPRCARTIAKKIGALDAETTYVFEAPSDQMVRYEVRGRSSQMQISKIRVYGKWTYSCQAVTGLTRCM